MTIGEKIKTLRKEKGLTQSALADGIVTRNMLSLIENGSAKPSLQTMKEFAERLGIPIGYLISDDGAAESAASTPLSSDDASAMRSLFRAGKYAECLGRANELSSTNDETALMIMRCAYVLGEESFKKRDMTSAQSMFTLAMTSAEKTAYATAEEISKIRRMYLLTDAVVSKKNFSDVPRTSYGETDETAAYVAAFYGVDIGDFELLLEHKNHIAILRLIKVGRLKDATKALLEQLKITSDKLTRYYLFRSLEECFRKSGDFKGTFEAAAQRRAAFEELVSK